MYPRIATKNASITGPTYPMIALAKTSTILCGLLVSGKQKPHPWHLKNPKRSICKSRCIERKKVNESCSVIHFLQTSQSSTCKQDEIPPSPPLPLWRIKEFNFIEVWEGVPNFTIFFDFENSILLCSDLHGFHPETELSFQKYPFN